MIYRNIRKGRHMLSGSGKGSGFSSRHLIQTAAILVMLTSLAVIVLGCRITPTIPGTTTGTTTPPTTTQPVLDSRLVGVWTNKDATASVSLNDQGEPTGVVPVGEWYSFSASGNYFWVGRFMTFAIGGVSVNEGKVSLSGDQLNLKSRTESFFPDEGSPQQKKYREPLTDTSLIIRFEQKDGQEVLIVKAGTDQPEVTFYRVKTS
jgi:hypothetical protein